MRRETRMNRRGLLGPGDPAPMRIVRPDGTSPCLLTCEHAGRAFPAALGTLGVGGADLERHIAWDIGAEQVALRVSEALGAPLLSQPYSRLVIDCNRAVGHPTSIPEVSDGTEIPGNRGVSAGAAAERAEAIHRPYHDAVTAALDARVAQGRPGTFVSVHSFTPVFGGVARSWHFSVMYAGDDTLGRLLIDEVERHPEICLGINEPYALDSARDFTVPFHGERRGIPHVEVELRQDLIADAEGQALWAGRLATWLTSCLKRLGLSECASLFGGVAAKSRRKGERV